MVSWASAAYAALIDAVFTAPGAAEWLSGLRPAMAARLAVTARKEEKSARASFTMSGASVSGPSPTSCRRLEEPADDRVCPARPLRRHASGGARLTAADRLRRRPAEGRANA